jgi:molybdopterin converting factor small subunit
MTITFQYLGILSEAIGKGSETLDLEGSLNEMIEEIRRRYPAAGKKSFVISLNGVITHEDKAVKEGDLVSLIPPAPGG